MNNLTQAQIENAKNMKCEKCNNETFTQTYVIKTISGLLTNTGKDMLAPVPIFACAKCFNINKLFSEELKIATEPSENKLHI
jgi:hypothetical protein